MPLTLATADEPAYLSIPMALGSWLGGAVFDATGTYRTAFLIGVAFNAGNLAIIASLIARTPGFRPAYA